MIKWLLSHLLHHANRETKMDEFYKIKDKILTKYGKGIGFDVQFIEGKKCQSCGGRGYHERVSWETGKVYDLADCYHCWGGWYKHPTWVLLERIQFGKFIFHKPVKKELKLKNPFENIAGLNISNEVIQGYIDHTRTKHGKDALVILFLLYDWKGFWARWYKSIGRGWYHHWSWIFKPRKWPNNIAHLIRYRSKAIPFLKKRKWTPPPLPDPVFDPEFIPSGSRIQPDDLPF